MKIDKEKLKELTSLSDDELWQQIRTVAESHGVKMPSAQPKKEEIEKVRDVLSEADKLNLLSAMKIVNSLKRGDK